MQLAEPRPEQRTNPARRGGLYQKMSWNSRIIRQPLEHFFTCPMERISSITLHFLTLEESTRRGSQGRFRAAHAPAQHPPGTAAALQPATLDHEPPARSSVPAATTATCSSSTTHAVLKWRFMKSGKLLLQSRKHEVSILA